ncbi:MAG: radical SAM protein [Armatimonadota bacterium]
MALQDLQLTPAAARCPDLRDRAAAAWELLKDCRLCPRRCGVNRLAEELGACRSGSKAVVASFGPHFGEEPPLVGFGGSGTIFLSNCNLRCIFCQNYEISHGGEGIAVAPEQLAQMMLALQARGCHNVNFVTPTHFMPQILQALVIAVQHGLRIPIVWNCGGYESVEALKLLDGVVDIYMPDFKYSSAEIAARLSGTPLEGPSAYPAACMEAIKEMHRQVGDLILDKRGIAVRGLLVRHLVLPNGLAGTEEIMRFLASLSKDTYVNIMDQYRPCYKAHTVPEINRRITSQEYEAAVEAARRAGLHRFA